MDILVGSRDSALRRQIAYALGGGRGRVTTTGKSGGVLVEALEHDFDLVIVDTDLEGMDGRETLDILRQMRPRLRVLFLHRAEDDVSSVVEAGAGRVATLVRMPDATTLMRTAERLVRDLSVPPSRASLPPATDPEASE